MYYELFLDLYQNTARELIKTKLWKANLDHSLPKLNISFPLLTWKCHRKKYIF